VTTGTSNVFGISPGKGLDSPLLGFVLDPVVILADHLPQDAPADGIYFPIYPEKALRSGTVQEGLNTAMQQKTVKAAVAELDVMLMVLDEGVHGQPPVW
jgi:hypothetical protein